MRTSIALVLVLAATACDFTSLFAPQADDDDGARRRSDRCDSDDECNGGERCDDGVCVAIGEGEGELPAEGEGELPGEGEGESPGEGEGEGKGEDDVTIDLTWNTPDGDLDLHLSRDQPATWCEGTGDCYFGARTSTWGATLEIDDLEGFGPERIRLSAPADGVYTVGVGVYTLDTTPVLATITVTQRGQVLYTSTRSLTDVPWQPVALEVSNGSATVEVLDLVEFVDGRFSCWGESTRD